MFRFLLLTFALTLIIVISSPLISEAEPNVMSQIAGSTRPFLKVKYKVFPPAPTMATGKTIGYNLIETSFMAPVWIKKPNIMMLSMNYSTLRINTNLCLPDSNVPFPKKLEELTTKIEFIRKLGDRRYLAADFRLISSGDLLFHSKEKLTTEMRLGYVLPSGEKNAWVFLVQLSNDRDFLNNIPIPGLGYFYNPTKKFAVFFGVPFAMVGLYPTKMFDLQMVFGLSNELGQMLKFNMGIKLNDSLFLHAGYNWSNSHYYHGLEGHNEHRFFYLEKRISTGLSYHLKKWGLINFTFGYAFDRHFFESNRSTNTDINLIEPASAIYGSMSFEVII